MLRSPLAPAKTKPATVPRPPLGGRRVGALLGLAVLTLILAGVPVLGWTLLAAVAAIALVDIVLTAAGRPSPSILEQLVQARIRGD